VEFDSVQIGAADVVAVAHAYEVLLGIPPVHGEGGAMRFQLRRGAVEVEPGDSGLHSLRFTVAANADRGRWPAEAFHGVRVSFTAAPSAPPAAGAADAVEAIDHVVINTPDLDRAIGLWRDRMGLRLALDREFPARGLRLVFFRSGGVTLEFAGPLPAPAERTGSDTLYGMAYRVHDLEACRARLLRAGVDVTEQRAGQKRGTTVATVRARTAGVPTLLIQDSSRPS